MGWLNYKGRIANSPSIAHEGTVYISSYDGILYALGPNNGNIKWEYPIGDELFYANPSLGDDGTIYLFGWKNHDDFEQYFYAVNPDGAERWTKHLDKYLAIIRHADPVISADGTIYVAGSCFGAFNNNGY